MWSNKWNIKGNNNQLYIGCTRPGCAVERLDIAGLTIAELGFNPKNPEITRITIPNVAGVDASVFDKFIDGGSLKTVYDELTEKSGTYNHIITPPGKSFDQLTNTEKYWWYFHQYRPLFLGDFARHLAAITWLDGKSFMFQSPPNHRYNPVAGASFWSKE